MIKRFLFVILLVLFSQSQALHAAKGPDEIVRGTIDAIMNAIENDEKIKSGDLQHTLKFVEEKVAPRFDFPRMTRLAVGRPWRQASPEQKAELLDQFRKLMVRSYASAFTKFRGIVVDVQPLRPSEKEGEAFVRSLIRLPGGVQPISVDYDMQFVEGEWKVFDIQIDGASLIINYRNIFGQEIDTNGLDGLIDSLKVKNASQ